MAAWAPGEIGGDGKGAFTSDSIGGTGATGGGEPC